MATFEQLYLKPGTYCVDADGQTAEITAADLQAYTEGTKAVIAAGYDPQVLLGHADPGTDESLPVDRKTPRDAIAERLRNSTGWIKDAWIGNDGGAYYQIEILDDEIAKKVESGAIKFTSPELRDSEWRDGNGKVHKRFISHTALTAKPRNIKQSKLIARQFSLDDLIEDKSTMAKANAKPANPVKQLDAEEKEEKKEAEKEVKSDVAADAAESEEAKEVDPEKAIVDEIRVVLADEFGVIVPEGDEFIPHLLTALKTFAAMKAKEEPEAAAAVETAEAKDAVEAQAPLQFSLDDAESGSIKNPLLAKVVKQEHAATVSRLDAMVRNGQITPALKDKLVSNKKALQFSADGAERQSFTLTEVVSLLEDGTLPGMSLDVKQLSTEAQPDDQFISGDNEITREQAKKLTDQAAAMVPSLRAK